MDGYRFVYCLPFAATRMFVEDTYYSDTPDDRPPMLLRGADRRLCRRARLAGRQAVREEAGVLPVAMGGDFEAYWRAGGNKVAKAGMRAGLFHPTTGYSLPDAVRTAALIAEATDLSGAALHDLTLARCARDMAQARLLPHARQDAVPGGRAGGTLSGARTLLSRSTPG